MARPKRLHIPHATYYVVNRFTPGVDILVAHPGKLHAPLEQQQIAANRLHFEEQLTSLTHRWGAQVDAHCWLPDATLFILKISLVSLEGIMHSLRGVFSHHLHTTAGLTSAPYNGRYQALLIDPDTYLLDFARHVMLAPVRAGLCNSAVEYPYSSLGAWLGEGRPKYLLRSRVPKALAARGLITRAGMVRFCAEHPTPAFPSLLRRGSRWDSRIVGSEHFVQEIHTGIRRHQHSDYIEPAIRWTAALLNIDLDIVQSRKRSHNKTLTLALAAWLITSTGTASLSQVARAVSCGKSTLHKAIERGAHLRPDLFHNATLSRYLAFIATESTRPPVEKPLGLAMPTTDSASQQETNSIRAMTGSRS